MTAVAQLPGIAEVGNDPRPSIHEALNRVMRQVRGVGKRGRNTQQNYNFRGIDDVLNAAGPAFRDHGIVPLPTLEDVTYRDVKTTTGKAAREVTVRVRYRFYGPRGDCLETVVPGESLDSGDKGVAKAMSVAFRIALIQVLALPTTERDPDSQTWERGTGKVDVEVDAQAREAGRLSRTDQLRRAKTTIERERQARGESLYAALDRVARYCAETLGVNVIRAQEEDGAVTAVELERLSDAQLGLLYSHTMKSIREFARETGADMEQDE